MNIKEKILYIDDEFFNLEGFKAVFWKQFEVFTSSSTHEAESILLEHEIKVIISDQRMPAETGLEFFKRIRNEFPNQVFIIVTGYTDLSLIIETINSGEVFRFITKPWEKSEMEHALKMAINTYDLKKQNQSLIQHLEEKNTQLNIRNKELIENAKALLSSETLLKQAQKVTKIGHYIFNFEINSWSNSESLDEIFGIDGTFNRNVEGWLQIVHPDYQSIMSDYLMNYVLGQKQRFDKIYQINTMDTNTLKWVHGIGDLIYDNSGNVSEMFGTIQDITDQIEAQEALKNSEQKFSTIFSSINDAIFVHPLIENGYAKFIEVNEVACKRYGYNREELLRLTAADITVNPEINEKGASTFSKRLVKSKNLVFETINKTKHGDEFPVEISANIEKLNGQEVILAVVRDITARKKMEQTIIENELFLNTIFESAPYVLALINESHQVVKTNLKPKIEFQEKRMPQDFKIGQILNCIGICPNVDANNRKEYCLKCPISEIYSETFATGKSFLKKEVELFLTENEVTQHKFFLVSTNLIKKEEEKYVLLTIDDITDEKHIEEELIVSKEKAQYNEKRYSLLSNLTFEGIVLHDNGTILDVNNSFVNLSGYKSGELINQNIILTIFPIEYRSIILLKMQQDYADPFEAMVLHKNGTLIPVEIEARNFKQRNKTLRVAAFRDLTERKQTEKKILQAVINAEETEKVRFAQDLHDGLGPILSNIQMYFQWLAEADENKEVVLQKGLNTLKNAFHTLREISNNLSPHILLDFGLVKALHWFVNQIPENPKLKINIQSTFSNSRFNNSIEVSLYRVINELINNSLKYSQAHNIIISLDKTNEHIIVNYTDDGIGFDLNQVVVSNKGHGFLNMSHRIRTLNGEFLPHSEPNQGMQVLIRLPLIPR